MDVFATVLRSRIADAAKAEAAARQAGRSDEAELHAARLADLFDLAAEHDIAVETQTDTVG
ncbi:hypothetical protein [Amycolatopsis sp. EV170708-02-1]|uniref:hypothetical protein n=1 Tax=Amycolatopsis sp. EV170708-02-1 TaxID=2919322 RepID=UPI001F0C72C2|nr:hypothetical protein [Amycolatopsis sp. EV170708-02-1]UMP06760.1 hypothetical protein MJQ72_18975 [Amycolatopsis sp. EV170708-02-1]